MRRLRWGTKWLACRFFADRAGVSATEFALILPVMIILFFGAVEISDALTINRKVTHAASALGDLVAQSKELSAADMQNIFKAADAIVAPYPASKLKIVLSQIKIDDDGKATIVWSEAYGGATAQTKGAGVTLPDSVKQSGGYVITSEVHYNYAPIIGHYFAENGVDLNDLFYLKPRLSEFVEYPKS